MAGRLWGGFGQQKKILAGAFQAAGMSLEKRDVRRFSNAK